MAKTYKLGVGGIKIAGQIGAWELVEKKNKKRETYSVLVLRPYSGTAGLILSTDEPDADGNRTAHRTYTVGEKLTAQIVAGTGWRETLAEIVAASSKTLAVLELPVLAKSSKTATAPAADKPVAAEVLARFAF